MTRRSEECRRPQRGTRTSILSHNIPVFGLTLGQLIAVAASTLALYAVGNLACYVMYLMRFVWHMI